MVWVYTITSGNTNNAFSIGTNTGVLTVNNAAALDHEATPSIALIVEVSDGEEVKDSGKELRGKS